MDSSPGPRLGAAPPTDANDYRLTAASVEETPPRTRGTALKAKCFDHVSPWSQIVIYCSSVPLNIYFIPFTLCGRIYRSFRERSVQLVRRGIVKSTQGLVPCSWAVEGIQPQSQPSDSDPTPGRGPQTPDPLTRVHPAPTPTPT